MQNINKTTMTTSINTNAKYMNQQRKLLIAYDNFRLMTSELFSCSEECIDAFLTTNSKRQSDIQLVGRRVSKSKYLKDCPKCNLKMTYGQLVTEEGYCLNCNHRGVF